MREIDRQTDTQTEIGIPIKAERKIMYEKNTRIYNKYPSVFVSVSDLVLDG